MSTFEWSLFLLAAAAGLGGLYILYTAWKRPGRPFHVAGGWALLLAAVVAGFVANGDRGLAQISVIVMVAACIYLAIPMMRGVALPVAGVRQRAGVGDTPVLSSNRVLSGLAGVWTFLLTGPIAGGIALFCAAGLFKLMRAASVSVATAGATTIIASVVIWAVVSVLLLMEPRAGRRSAYAGGALIFSLIAAFAPL
ncbi:hypothetical protein D1224_01380 [Henriciella barbarensis]|uniref:Uncharacterized protein n=1 Tax=Henriciella barbarensis TaxID=86342 RepID=A0A399R5E3_9PROT|nr:hypothetical protein [Henriciella barbarensis]RIJ25801.1 hypothetical protein D1224_01380 [Henriciella barbarensis]